MSLHFGWRTNTGLLCIAWNQGFTALHIGILPADWVWGWREGWWDGPIHEFGLGPLIYFAEMQP